MARFFPQFSPDFCWNVELFFWGAAFNLKKIRNTYSNTLIYRDIRYLDWTQIKTIAYHIDIIMIIMYVHVYTHVSTSL